MRRSTLLTLVVAGVGILAATAMGEVALRVYAAVHPRFATALRAYDPMGVQIEPHGVLGYRQRPNATFHYANGVNATSNALGYRGPVVPIQPAPGTIRILLFGGSTSHGWEVPDDQTIDAHMRTILHDRFPGRRFEVVNLAFDGYDSYQDLQRLQSDGLPMHPSIVILNTGINDVRNAWFPNLQDPDPRTLIWEDDLRRMRAEEAHGGPSLWTRIKHDSFLARTPGYIRGQVQWRRTVEEHSAAAVGSNPSEMPGGPIPAAAGAKAPYPDAAELFDRHVRQMVSLALDHGAAVLLSTPPSALRRYPDTTTSKQSYWVGDAAVTQAYRDELSRRMVAVQAEETARGHAVRYIAPVVPAQLFLDDCHLKGPGNRVVAAAFIDAILPFLASDSGSSRSSLAPDRTRRPVSLGRNRIVDR